MSKKWDSYCHNCSLCCYEKIYKNGECVIILNRPCSFLDVENKICMIYKDRFKRNSLCRKMTLKTAMFSDFLPPSCGYVRKFRKFNFIKSPLIQNSVGDFNDSSENEAPNEN